ASSASGTAAVQRFFSARAGDDTTWRPSAAWATAQLERAEFARSEQGENRRARALAMRFLWRFGRALPRPSARGRARGTRGARLAQAARPRRGVSSARSSATRRLAADLLQPRHQ